MGTFTDYVIRKMFRDRLVNPDGRITEEKKLIAQLVDDRLQDLITDSSKINAESIRMIEEEGADWIRSHRKETWEDCISASFKMSQMDSIYRAGAIGEIHTLSTAEEEGISQYLHNILQWLKEDFGNAHEVLLNLILTHDDVCPADADIIIDDTLFDIKTVKRPHEYLRKSKNQLLGYVALADHESDSHPLDYIDTYACVEQTGFLFPQSLHTYRTSLEDYTDEDRKYFVAQLQELVRQESPEGASSRKREETDFLVQIRKGSKYLKSKKYDMAEGAFRSAIQIGPEPLSFIPRMNLLEVLIEKGKIESAMNELVITLQEIRMFREIGKEFSNLDSDLDIALTNLDETMEQLTEKLEVLRGYSGRDTRCPLCDSVVRRGVIMCQSCQEFIVGSKDVEGLSNDVVKDVIVQGMTLNLESNGDFEAIEFSDMPFSVALYILENMPIPPDTLKPVDYCSPSINIEGKWNIARIESGEYNIWPEGVNCGLQEAKDYLIRAYDI
jgi:tetratricopeptide (TPR) repeat protein